MYCINTKPHIKRFKESKEHASKSARGSGPMASNVEASEWRLNRG